MNATHLHLLITHLPIVASILGALVLFQGIYARSLPTKIAAYNIFVLAAIGAAIAYFTGESAEESVEHMQGIAKNAIDEHEDFAVITFISLLVLGVASLAGIYLSLKKSPLSRSTALGILFISLISFGLAARTGYLGGQIRHTEIGSTAAAAQQNAAETEDDD